MKVLIVDDEDDLRDLLSFALRRAGYTVTEAHDAARALRVMRNDFPDIMVLDVNLHGADGFEVLRDVRRFSRIPVLMLTARQAEEDRIYGLQLGADDYIIKPFSHRELVARVGAHLRRAHTYGQAIAAPAKLTVGALELDEAQHVVMRDGEPLNLTVTEFRLLQHLMANPNTPVSTKELLRRVWGHEDMTAGNVVRTTIHRLRHKLERRASEPEILTTIPGVGFLLRG